VADALSVAREFVRLSLAGSEPDPLTNLRLQKLLYYAQGWSLALRNANLFAEEIQARHQGPVVGKVYRALSQGQKAGVINERQLGKAHDLLPEEAALVKAVWETYRRYSATQLAELAHNEAPWRMVWGDGLADGRGAEAIPDQAIADHFDQQPVPAPLEAFRQHLGRMIAEAREAIAAMPPIDMKAFAARAARIRDQSKATPEPARRRP
jgi:uncharacterized phage-associated protein